MPLRASLIPPAKREPSHRTARRLPDRRDQKFVVHHTIDVAQATQRVVVVQVNAGAAKELRIPPIRLTIGLSLHLIISRTQYTLHQT